MTRKKALINNTAINTFATVYIAFLQFLLIPILIENLGVIEFGLIGLINIFSMLGYISFFDFGMASSIQRYIAAYKSRKEYSKVNILLNTALGTFLIIGFFTAISLVFLSSYISEDLFDIPNEYIKTFSFVLSIFALSYIYQFPLMALQSVLEGLLRFDVVKLTLAIVETVKFVAIYFLVINGNGFENVVVVNMLAPILTFITFCISVIIIIPNYRFLTFSFDSIREIKRFSGYQFVGKFSSLVYNNSDRLLIGAFLSPAFMASYDVLWKLPAMVNKFLGLAVSALIPVASSIDIRKEPNLPRELYHRGFRFYFAFISPIIISLIFFSKDFLLLWVGEEFLHIHKLLISLLLFSLCGTLAFGGNILMGLNKAMFHLTIFRISQALFKFGALFLLINELLLRAVPTSYFISLIPILFLLRVFYINIGLKIFTLLKDIVTILVSSILPILMWYYIFDGYHPDHILKLGMSILLWCVLQWIQIYYITFDEVDRKNVINTISRKI